MYQQIYPKPHEIVCDSGSFEFGTEVTMEISKDFGKEQSLKLFAEMWKNFTSGICRLNIVKTERSGDFLWTIGKPGNIKLKEGMAYCVHTDKNGIAIKADSDLSLIHGFYTLLQIIRPLNLKKGEERFCVNCGRIDDAPSLKFRCMHFG